MLASSAASAADVAKANPAATVSSPAQIADASVLKPAPGALAPASVSPTADVAPAPGMTQVYRYANEGAVVQQSQVTSVSQLSDVRPTDWAFQALQSLVERYGCIVGYPDRTYRGNQALTRYEFAAGLNSCLDRVNELIAAGTADLVRKEDLAVLQRLQEEFGAELATLRGRVDALETRTATLERQQFSTTTKLSGEVIFNITDTQGDAVRENGSRAARAIPGGRFIVNNAATSSNRDDRTKVSFSDRVRLSFDSSFSGRDRLRVRLNAANIISNQNFTGTQQTRLAFDGDNSNSVVVDKLNYRFPIGQNLRVQIDAINTEFTADSLITTLSPFESSGLGAVSRFGRFNPFYRNGNASAPSTQGTTLFAGNAGITAAYRFSDNFRVEAGFVSDRSSNDPSVRNGLIDGSYSALGQVVFTSNALSASIGYARTYFPRLDPGYNLTGGTGSFFAQQPLSNATGVATDNFGAQVQLRLNPRFLVGGWYSLSLADQLGTGNEATIQTGAVYLALPDFGKKGNLLGLLAGIPPKVTRSDVALRRDSDSTSYHVEAFYRYRLNDNIAITPGLFVIFNPENNNANSTQYVGTIRTTFTF